MTHQQGRSVEQDLIHHRVHYQRRQGRRVQNKRRGYIESVKGNELETLGYQWYLSEDGTRCLLQETFSSSEAMLTHLGNVGPSLPELLAIAPITRLEVLGSASPAAVDALADLGAVHFPHMAGFDR